MASRNSDTRGATAGTSDAVAVVTAPMKTLIALLLAFALVATACGDDDDRIDAGPADGSTSDPGTGTAGDDPSTGDPFGDTVWQLASGVVDGADLELLATHPITLTRTVDGIGGTAACNSYGGTIEVDGTAIVVDALFQTEMACTPDEAMTLEAAYLAALGQATEVRVDDTSLTLSGEGIELVFSAQATVADAELTGTAWVLDSIIEGESVSSTVAGSEAPLTIAADGALTGTTGCNRMSGTITFDDTAWEAAELVTTRMACEPALMTQEAAVLRVLSGAPTWSIEGETLTLMLADGAGLQYRVG